MAGWKIFIGSTAVDLPKYRRAAIEVCQELGLEPIFMERFPPDPRNAVDYCRARVAEADAYLGIYAHRYGYVPDGSDTSLTEMEYRWAMERGLPALIFCVDDDFRWSPKMIDGGEVATKLRAFKGRVGVKHVLKKFTTVESFRADLYPALLPYHDAVQGARPRAGDTPQPRYKDRRTEELGERLRVLKKRQIELLITRAGPDERDRNLEEIRSIKRALLRGGRLKEGYPVSDRYQLLEAIGTGGFATVWRAFDAVSRELVALKVLHGQHADDPSRRERFFRGAHQMALLGHPHIVRVIQERGEDDGHHYFVMEYLAGGDFQRKVLGGGTSVPEVHSIIQSIGEALQHAHDKRIIHRDVKPSNILLDDSGVAKLTDFDLVRAQDSFVGTYTHQSLGTLIYAAPELLESGKKADVRSDVFSLGMTTLFGFSGSELDLEDFRHPDQAADRLAVPSRVKAVLKRATDWKPDRRFQTIREFCEQLREAFRSDAQPPHELSPERPEPASLEKVTPEQGPHRSGRVRWLSRAVDMVQAELKDQFESELEQVFDESVTEITAHNVYPSYGRVQAENVILGVGVRSSDRNESHIVKLGTKREAGSDIEGWRGCVGNRDIGSRIFVRLRAKDLPGGRVAVVYENALVLHGLAPWTQPEFLEDVTNWAILDDKPDPVSVERVLGQVYGDLNRCFYFAGRSYPAAAKVFYEKQLERTNLRWQAPAAGSPLPAGMRTTDIERATVEWWTTLRGDATWLLGGLDPPGSTARAVYLDPFDYVRWALKNDKLPSTLVGCSHGDLHGRNVLVDVRRGEAEFPVVIDYGAMRPTNVLAWDFVKLEVELKIRLLPRLFLDSEVEAVLLNRRGDRTGLPEDRAQLSADEKDRAARARRLALCFEFETLLAEATSRIDGRLAAEPRQPPGGRPVFAANCKLDRALILFLRIRQEAALWLGYQQRRHAEWKDEFYFALAAYGLNTAKWDDYEPRQTECALVSAGVAVAQMEQAQRLVRDLIESQTAPPPEGPSYRPVLAYARRLLNAYHLDQADAVIEQALGTFPHAVPLRTESALIKAEKKDLTSSLRIIAPLRRLCWVFGDPEILMRIGRIYKAHGNEAWDRLGPPYAPMQVGTTAWQYYYQALSLYRDAYDISRGDYFPGVNYDISRGHYFPGVNVVNVALVVGDQGTAQRYADIVLATCQGLQPDARGHDLYWISVSQGEAALGSSRPDRAQLARSYYASALDLVGPAEIRMVQSSWDQLCRLWHVLDRAVIGAVVQEFTQRPELWKILKRGPLGDCGFDGQR
jgi:serine/threonine protein kinase